MELQRTLLFLLISLFAIGFALFSAWQQEHPAVNTPQKVESSSAATAEGKIETDIPGANIAPALPLANAAAETPAASLIEVTTDVLKIKIDPLGGDIVRAELRKYPESLQSKEGVVLLDKTANRNYVAQSGLIGKDELGPDSRQLGRAPYTIKQTEYSMGNDEDQLRVDLLWQNDKGIHVTKTFLFKRNNYLVDVNYQINNTSETPWLGSFYGQIRREIPEVKSSLFGMGVQMYQGGALYTPDKPYKKISLSDMTKAPFREQITGGWAALLERYFLCAWIPESTSINNYYTRVDGQHTYNIGEVTAVEVAPKTEEYIHGQFYIGPEIADVLKTISPGLNLTIDYGLLWPISQLLFWLLKTIHSFVGNWGWSIIFVTLIIKILFYKLSATSYRSMGKMRLMQPRIELLKERHKDDKQQFSAALMDLYRKEKMNPLGGCLPILIQIPVFIALYYVLLESVELRHAPFMLWIQDLSSKDPYYVLPLIMGATMYLQQKMNPAPPDPVQARVMMFMPVIFTVLFLSFPAGLVLYWTVNSLLSVAQQWFITRTLEREGIANKKS